MTDAQVDDLNVVSQELLISPAALKQELPLTDKARAVVTQGETATRSSAIVRDNEVGVATRTVSGVAFDGTSYAGERVISRTENGLERVSNYSDSTGNSHSGYYR